MGKLLNSIISPRQLKDIPLAGLPRVSGEIRKLIIDICSKKGGHLASSLGAVELCIALHYVLDTPKDSIVFDVGHQAYAHKILTGRLTAFPSIREFGGISGFPSHTESEFDPFSVGHASNAVSLALGLVAADKLKNSKRKVVAVIGDGSLSGGECFEALNNAGHLGADILVVFNHNTMSISRAVGALSNYFNKFISLPVYNRFRDIVESFVDKFPKVKRMLVPRIHKFEEIVKGLLTPGIFFEELGFRYFGPLDGHNLEALIPALRNIIALPGPKLLHVVTKKGKGYQPAEEDAESFHSAGRFFKDSGGFKKKEEVSYTDVFGYTISKLAKSNKNIVVITAAMERGTGLDKFKEQFPKRFFDAGIAEQHVVSFAAGLSKGGLQPVVAVYSTFLQRAYDQLIEDIALQELGVVFCIDRAGIVGEDGPTHHGVFDIAYLRPIPHFVIMAPAHQQELEKAIDFGLQLGLPCAIRYPKENVFLGRSSQPMELGRFEVVARGTGLAVIALGSMLKPALKAVDMLKKDGLKPYVINPRFIKPLDEALLLQLSEDVSYVAVLEEGVLTGGFGESILDFYRVKGLLPKIKIGRLGIPDKFITFGARDILLKEIGLDPQGIYKQITQLISGN